MIEWHRPDEKEPDDGAECLLLPPHVPLGFRIPHATVLGPITWESEAKAWVRRSRRDRRNILSVIEPESVGLWTYWEPIKPPRVREVAHGS